MSERTLRVLLTLYLAAVLRITLWPRLGDEAPFTWLEDLLSRLQDLGLPAALGMTVLEAAANVVMFVPLGLLLPAVTRWRPGTVVLAGAVLSAAVETTQGLFLPERVATVQDVVMNTAGALVGVLLVRRHRLRTTGPAGGRGPRRSASHRR